LVGLLRKIGELYSAWGVVALNKCNQQICEQSKTTTTGKAAVTRQYTASKRETEMSK